MSLLKYKTIQSPVGHLKIVVQDDSLVAILWDQEKANRVKLNPTIEEENDALILEVEKQLNDYFLNQRINFDVPIAPQGTPFQKEVWQLLSHIPYGTVWSYKDMAQKLHRPQSARAIGSAIGRNPISIIVPCHRVIGSNGTLTGFAGGLERKKYLLNLEVVS